jgi:hypothetical protein
MVSLAKLPRDGRKLEAGCFRLVVLDRPLSKDWTKAEMAWLDTTPEKVDKRPVVRIHLAVAFNALRNWLPDVPCAWNALNGNSPRILHGA